MRFTSFVPSRSAAASSGELAAARAHASLAALGVKGLIGVTGLLLIACQDAPVDLGDAVDAPPPAPPAPPAEPPAGAVIDLGIEAPPTHSMDGFSLPERVGSRIASWSEGELSTIAFDVRGGAKSYQVAFLAEPYHMLGEVRVGISLNKRPLTETTVLRGWRAYRVVAPGDRVGAGHNVLAFHYSKTGRPSDFDPRSNDLRELSVRFDQIQVQPITDSVELAFGSKNALALAALGDGWARDPSDRGTGTWTIASRALIEFQLARPEAGPSVYSLSLAARTPRGVAERSVSLTLNGAPLGTLRFQDEKATAVVDVPAERLKADNELALEFSKLEPPAALDRNSKDSRLLGLRVFELDVAPKALASQ
jgi:hypothetical protein